jgi:hypothetical protein
MSSQRASLSSSSSSTKRRVSLGTSSETLVSHEPHLHSKQSYQKHHHDKKRSALFAVADYQHESHGVHHYSAATTKSKKRYTGNNVIIPPHQASTSSDYHHYHNRSYSGEGKENLPSPSYQNPYGDHHHQQQYHHPTAGYEDSSYTLQQGAPSYPVDHHRPYSNEYHVNCESHYHQGPPSQVYHPSNNTVDPRAFDDQSNFHASCDGRDKRGFAFVDHTYRDFSGVPPTEEDRERYNNKKNEYDRRIKEQKTNSKSSGSAGAKESDPNSRALKKRRGRGNRSSKSGTGFIGFMGTNFPARLHDLLSHEEEIADIITWLPHGRSWIVLNKAEFLKKVAPSHFQISKFESFTRQVNGWGFKRITQGPDINSYYHELFLRGMPHLIQWMKRSTSSGSGRRKIRADPKDEPDFYSISQMYPIPDYYNEHGSGQLVTRNAPLGTDKAINEDTISGKKRNSNEFYDSENIPSPINPNKRSKVEKNQNVKNIKGIVSSLTHPPHLNEIYTSSVPPSSHTNGALASSTFVSYESNQHKDASSSGGGTYGSDRGTLTTVYDSHHPCASLQPSDLTQVENLSWTGNHHHHHHHSFNNQRPHSQHLKTTSAQFHQDTYHHPERFDDHYTDFKPSEGTIGDREAFRWDDADYVREHHDRVSNHDDSDHQTTKQKENHSSKHKYSSNVNFDFNSSSEQDHGYPGSCSAIVSDDTNDSSTAAFLHSFTPYKEDNCQYHQRQEDGSIALNTSRSKDNVEEQEGNVLISSDTKKSIANNFLTERSMENNAFLSVENASPSLRKNNNDSSSPIAMSAMKKDDEDAYGNMIVHNDVMPESSPCWTLI